jgi:hypothetical protein
VERLTGGGVVRERTEFDDGWRTATPARVPMNGGVPVVTRRRDRVPWTQIVVAKLLASTASLNGVSSQRIGDGRCELDRRRRCAVPAGVLRKDEAGGGER